MLVEQYYPDYEGPAAIYTRYRCEHGNLIEHTDHNFKPYFWVPTGSDLRKLQQHFPKAIVDTSSPHTRGIDGTSLVKVVAHTPLDVPEMRRCFDTTYEADVRFPDRYLIDKYPTMPEWTPRKCWFDIEWHPEEQFTQVWCAIDSFTDEQIGFAWHTTAEKYEVEEREEYTLHIYASEEAVHEAVIQYIEDRDFDMLIAHAAMWADMPHMVARFKNYKRLSPVHQVSRVGKNFDGYRHTDQPIKGRWILDTAAPGGSGTGIERVWMDSGNGQLPSRKLNEIGKLFGLGEKDEVDIHADWEDNFYRLTDYCMQDVRLLRACDEHVRCSDFFISMVGFCGVSLSSTFNVGQFARGLVSRRTHLKFPTRDPSRRRERGSLKGATVMVPTPGLHESVLVADFKGLYPSIMLGDNLCWTTRRDEPSDTTRTMVNGTHWDQSNQGVLPSVVEYLFDERQKFKDAGEKGLEKAVKRVMASLYGLTAETKGHGMADAVLADTILSEGRRSIETMADHLYELGYEVLYGHTDSCFIKCPLDEIEEVCHTITSIIQKETGNMSLVAEPEVWMPYWFCGDVKNRYAGVIQWPDKEAGHLKVSGFEMKHSSTAPLSASLQRDVLTMIGSGQSEEDIGTLVKSMCDSIRSGECNIEQLSYTTRISKAIEPDEDPKHHDPKKHYPRHAGGYARAARYYNWYLANGDNPFTKGNSVKWTYVSGVPDGNPDTPVIAYHDGGELERGYTFDTETIIQKMVRDKLRLVYDVLRWDLSKVTDKYRPKGYW